MKVPKTVRRYVKREIHKNIETKWYYKATVVTSITDVANIVDVTTVPRGVTATDRIGQEVVLRALRLRLTMTVGDNTNFVRIIFFQWYQSTGIGLSPSVLDILEQTTITGGPVPDYMAPIQQTTRQVFHVLYDRVFTLSIEGDTAVRSLNFRIPLKYARKKINYDPESAVSGSNHIFYLIVSDSGAVTHPNYSMTTEMYYDDA